MIIDMHTHLYESNGFLCFDLDHLNFLKRMDELNIDAVIHCNGGLERPEFEKNVKQGIELYEKMNHRVYTYFVYDPRYHERGMKCIEENANHPAFVGIKIHPSCHNVYADDEAYRPVWEAAKKYNFPILAHTWVNSSYNPNQKFAVPERFEKFIKEYPEVTFIFGHSGGRTAAIRTAAELAAKYENAYLDIAGDVFEARAVEYLAKTAGAKKVLFGSDVYWFDPSTQMGLVLGANLSDEEKADILKGNTLRIFKKIKL